MKTNRPNKALHLLSPSRMKLSKEPLRSAASLLKRKIAAFPRKSDAVIIGEYRWEACATLLSREDTREMTICFLREGPIYLCCLLPTVASRIIALFTKRRLPGDYIYWFLRFTKPKEVYTYIDDSPSIYITASRLPFIDFFIFQNGIRPTYDLSSLRAFMKKFSIKDLGNVQLNVHGQSALQDYGKYLGEFGINIAASGSLLSNTTKLIPFDHVKRKKVALISQFRRNLGYINCGGTLIDSEDFYSAESLTIRCAKQVLGDYAYTLEVIGSNSWQGDIADSEERFFTAAAGYPITIDNTTNGYNAHSKYDFLICIDSTLGLEAASRGMKVMFADIRLINHPELYRQRCLTRLFRRAGLSNIMRFVATSPDQLQQKIINTLLVSRKRYNAEWMQGCGDFVMAFNPIHDSTTRTYC